jgi:hypothetical protein
LTAVDKFVSNSISLWPLAILGLSLFIPELLFSDIRNKQRVERLKELNDKESLENDNSLYVAFMYITCAYGLGYLALKIPLYLLSNDQVGKQAYSSYCFEFDDA